MDLAIIEKEALQLLDKDRAILADRLLSSISQFPEDLVDCWVKESIERVEAFRNGEIDAVDGPRALADLKARFAK